MIATPAVTGSAHTAVLAAEVIENLSPRDQGIYVDGTLGFAGHAQRILECAPGASLIGIDRDPMAIAASRMTLAKFGDRVRLTHGTYADLPRILGEIGVGRVDG